MSERYEVECFSTLGEAMAALPLRPPDLLVADVALPDGCGLDLVGLLRAPDGSRVPAIVLSGRKAESDYVRGFAAGAADYLAKPFTSAELLARCQVHLARAAARSSPHEATELPSRDGLAFGRYEVERELGRGRIPWRKRSGPAPPPCRGAPPRAGD